MHGFQPIRSLIVKAPLAAPFFLAVVVSGLLTAPAPGFAAGAPAGAPSQVETRSVPDTSDDDLGERAVPEMASVVVPNPDGAPASAVAPAAAPKLLATNLAPEPGFEAAGGWTPIVKASWPGTSIWRGSWGIGEPHTGTSAYAISNQAYGTLTSDAITVTAGLEYALSLYLRGELDTDDSRVGAKVRVHYYDGGGTQLSITDVYTQTSALPADWTQVSGTVTVPTGAVTARISLWFYQASGWIAFDDLDFRIVGGKFNLLVNPGFESPTGWTPTVQGAWPGTAIWRGGTGAATPRTGEHAYVISNGAWGAVHSDPIVVTGGQPYDVAFDIRGRVDAEDSALGARVIVTTYTAYGSPIESTEVFSSDVSGLSDSWSRVSVTMVTPENAANAGLSLWLEQANGWVALDEVWIAPHGTSTNLVANPGFEVGGSWTAESLWPATAAWRGSWGTAAPSAGTYAYSLGNQAYGYPQSDAIPVAASTAYDLSAWVRGEQDADVSTVGWSVGIRFFDASGTHLVGANVASNLTDTLTETWQQVGGTVTSPAGAATAKIELRVTQGAGWVAYDDVSLTRTPPTVQFAQAEYTVGEADGQVELTVILSHPPEDPVSVDYTTVDGTAIAGEDYVATAGTLSWAAGDGSSRVIVVPIADDGIPELDSDFSTVLVSPVGCQLGSPGQVAISIQDNDLPSVSVQYPAYSIDETGGLLSVTIDISSAPVAPVSVVARTVDDGANAGVDFVAVDEELVWGPGESGSKTIEIEILDDANREGGETFVVDLSPTYGAHIGIGESDVVIRDDELSGVEGWRFEIRRVWVPPGVFTEVPFRLEFDDPIVVVTGGEATRIRNVTPDSFEVQPLRPPGDEPIMEGVDVEFVAIDRGVHLLPGGRFIVANWVETTAVQSGAGLPSWHHVDFPAGTFVGPPSVLAHIQDMVNGNGVAPWLTTAIRGIVPGGFDVALERSEVTVGDVVSPERIGYIAFPTDGEIASLGCHEPPCEAHLLAWVADEVITSECTPLPTTEAIPVLTYRAVLASRLHSDGGWLVTCSDHGGAFRVVEDRYSDPEVSHKEESASVLQLNSFPAIALVQAPQVYLSYEDPDAHTVEEGNPGPVRGVVTTSEPWGEPITVNLSSSSDADLVYPGSVTIPATETEVVFDVSAFNDNQFEGPETITLEVTSVENGVEDGEQSIEITILDDDPIPVISFSPESLSVSRNEGATGVNTVVTLDVTLAGNYAGDVTAEVVVLGPPDTTATSEIDYTFSEPAQLTWENGASGPPTTGSVAVTIHGDDLDEDNGTVALALTNVTGPAAISTTEGGATVTITDDDPLPVVSISVNGAATATVTEPGGGGSTVQAFDVVLTPASGRTVTVPFAVGNASSATMCPEGCDALVQTSSPLTFTAGDTTRTVDVTVFDDNDAEGPRTIIIGLEAPTNADLSAPQSATLTIVDDDSLPVVGFTDVGVVVSEGDSTGGIEVTISPAPPLPVTVDWSTVDGSARSTDGDYTPASGQLEFDSEHPTLSIPGIETLLDGGVETLEEFTVVLSFGSSQNAALGTSSFTVTIRDPTAAQELEGVAPGQVVSGAELRAYSPSLVAAIALGESPQVVIEGAGAGGVTATLSGQDLVVEDGYVVIHARDELGLDLPPGDYEVSVGVDGEGGLFSDRVPIEVVPAGNDAPIPVSTVDTDVCAGWDKTHPIVPGQTVEGTWENGSSCSQPTTDTDYFTFVAGQGAHVSVWLDRDPDLTIGPLHPDSTSPELLLVRPDGVVFAAATPVSLDSSRASIDIDLPMDGRYVIGARTSRSSGAFVLHLEVGSTEDGLVPRFGYTRERAHVVAGGSLQAALSRTVVDRFGAPISGMSVTWESGTLDQGQFTPDGVGVESQFTDVAGSTMESVIPPAGGALQSWRARLPGVPGAAKRLRPQPRATPFLGFVQFNEFFVEGATLPSAAQALTSEAAWRRSDVPSAGAAKSLDVCDVGDVTCSDDIVSGVVEVDLGGAQFLSMQLEWKNASGTTVGRLDDPSLTVLSTVEGLHLEGGIVTTGGSIPLDGIVAAVTAVGDHGSRVLPSVTEACSRANLPVGTPLGYRVGRSAGFADPLAGTWLEREVLSGSVEVTYQVGPGIYRSSAETRVTVVPRPGEACEVRSLLVDVAPGTVVDGASVVTVPVFPWNIGYLNYKAGQIYAADVCGNIQIGMAPDDFLNQVSSTMIPPPTVRVEPSGDGFSHGVTLLCSQTGLQLAPSATTSVELEVASGVSTCASPGTLQLAIHTESGAPSVGLWWDNPRPVPGGDPEDSLISPEAALRDLETGEPAVWRLIAAKGDTSLDIVFDADGYEYVPGGSGTGVPVRAYVARRSLVIEPDGTVGRNFLEPVPGVELCTGIVERKASAVGQVNWNCEVRVSCDTVLATPTGPGELYAFADPENIGGYDPNTWVDVGVGVGVSRAPSDPGEYYLVVEPLDPESEFRRGESWRLPLQWGLADEYVRFGVGGGVFLDERYEPIVGPIRVIGSRSVFLNATLPSIEAEVTVSLDYIEDDQVQSSGSVTMTKVNISGSGSGVYRGSIALLSIGVDASLKSNQSPITVDDGGLLQASFQGNPVASRHVATTVEIDVSVQSMADDTVPGINEINPGGLVPLNSDDTNHNGIVDFQEASPIPGETSLVPIEISSSEELPPGELRLYSPTGGARIRVWRTSEKEESIDLPHTWLADSQELPLVLYVEGVAPSSQLSDSELTVQFTVPSITDVVAEDSIRLTIADIDLDIDSDNDDGFNLPERTQDEDRWEDYPSGDPVHPGKYIPTNVIDADTDRIVDFADGYNRDGSLDPNDDDTNGDGFFTPIVVVLPSVADPELTDITIAYSYSDPAGVTTSGVSPDIQYQRPDGGDRIWTVGGGMPRIARAIDDTVPGNLVPPGTYAATSLGFAPGVLESTLYVESVAPSSAIGADRVTIQADIDGEGPWPPLLSDTVAITNMELQVRDMEDGPRTIFGGSIAWIGDAPRMPRLEARIAPDPGNIGTVAWTFESRFDRGNIPAVVDIVSLPQGLPGGRLQSPALPWDIDGEIALGTEPIFGGKAQVRAAGLPGYEAALTFEIRGRNPSDGDCRDYIDNHASPGISWYAFAVFRHESSVSGHVYNQFRPSGDDTGWPLHATLAGDDGWGTAMLDSSGGAITPPLIWDWRANVDRGLQKLEDDFELANSWMNDLQPRDPINPVMPNGQRPQARIDVGLGVYQPDPDGNGVFDDAMIVGGADVPVPDRYEPVGTTDFCFFTDSGAVGSHPIEYAVAIKVYNGAAVHYCFWDDPDWVISAVNNLGFNYVERICQEVNQLP